MTSYATNITPFATPARSRTGPLLAIVVGGVLAVLATILVLGAAALFWAGDVKTDADGYYTTATHTYSSPTRALVTDNLDIDAEFAGEAIGSDRLGRLRIDPQVAGGAKPAFVGVAPTRDVKAYLDGVQHEQISDINLDPFTLDKRRAAGEGRPAMPGAQTFWSATSTDGRALDWTVRSGDWSVVVMNADGSPGVKVDAAVGATAPFIRDLAWFLMAIGIGLAVIALAPVVLGLRGLTRVDGRPAAPASAPAA